jgi:hypothetical protein
MNITLIRNVAGISAEVSNGQNEATAAKTLEWDGGSSPSSIIYRGSGSRTTPQDAVEGANLIAKAAQIGAIFDEIKEFPQRLVGSSGHVSVEFTDQVLRIAIHGDGGAENAFAIVQSLVSILAKFAHTEGIDTR